MRTGNKLVGRAALLATVLAVVLASPVAAAWSRWLDVNNSSYGASFADSDAVATSGTTFHAIYTGDPVTDPSFYYARYQEGDVQPQRRTLTYACQQDQGIAADGGVVVALCSDFIPGDLWYFRSIDDGHTWSTGVKLGSGAMGQAAASVAISGATVLVGWTVGSNGNVVTRRSSDSGENFGPLRVLGSSTAGPSGERDGQLKLAARGSSFYAVWHKQNAGQALYQRGMVLRRSTDGGATWKPKLTLVSGSVYYMGPSIVATQAGAIVAYTAAGSQLRALRSTDGGRTFSSRNLTSQGSSEDQVDIAASGSKIRVMYSHYVGNQLRMYVRRSSDSGRHWTSAESAASVRDDYAPYGNVSLLDGATVVTYVGKDNNPSNELGLSIYANRSP
jgi:hypothetical protein